MGSLGCAEIARSNQFAIKTEKKLLRINALDGAFYLKNWRS